MLDIQLTRQTRFSLLVELALLVHRRHEDDLQFTNYNLQFGAETVAAIGDRGKVEAASCRLGAPGSAARLSGITAAPAPV